MTIKVIITVYLISFLGMAQDKNDRIPDYTPASPEAYALTKYGDIDVKEFSGMINTNIPIYNYTIGNLEIPISLNYIGAGVKVNDLSTWTGINWTLNAGGVITRTVNGVPDEQATTRFFAEDLNSLTLMDGHEDVEYLSSVLNVNGFNSTQFDTKPDIFNFNFAGYSGSFFLDKNMIPTPRLAKKDNELKIEIGSGGLYSSKEFIITTPEGVKYFFGQNEVEESKLTSSRHMTATNLAPTAFYLYQIEHPIYGYIFFEYDTIDNLQIINLDESYQYTKLSLEEVDAETNFADIYCADSDNPDEINSISTSPIPIGSLYVPSVTQLELHKSKYLKRIYANDSAENVIFNSSPTSGNNNYKRILNSIEVKVFGNQFFKAEFDYEITSSRFFLKKVDLQNIPEAVNTQDGRRNLVYKMEYYGGLPARFSFAQDHLGYYNGKLNNQTLIPKNDNPEFSSSNNYLADREADFIYARAGALKRIYYPTSGFTEFEYEPFIEKDFRTNGGVLQVFRNNYQNNITKLSSTYTGLGFPELTDEFDEDGNPIITGGEGVAIAQRINIDVTMESDYYTYHQDQVTIKLINLTDTINETKNFVMDVAPDITTENNITKYKSTRRFNFYVERGKHYNIELSVSSNGESAERPMMATANISLIDGFKKVDGAGVRIKRIKDFISTQSNPTNIKRYYYTKARNLEVDEYSYIPYRKKPVYVDYFTHVKKCVQLDPSGLVTVAVFPRYWYYKRLKSSTNDLNENFSRVYEDVTISYGGDDFEKGGVQKTFSFTRNNALEFIKTPSCATGHWGETVRGSFYSSDTISYAGNTHDIINGTLIKEITIIKKNNKLYKQKEVTTNYDIELNYVFDGALTGGQPFYYFDAHRSYSSYQLAIYYYLSQSLQIGNQVSKEYIDLVPIPMPGLEGPIRGTWSPYGDSDLDGIPNYLDDEFNTPDEEVMEENYNKIVTTQNYEYGALRGLPTKITSTTSQSGVINEVRNHYVNEDVVGLGFPTSQASLITTLKDKNIVSTPILVQQFKNNEKLGTKRTLYKNIGTNPSFPKIVPDSIQSGKGEEIDNPLENRIRFLEYDGFGRPTLVSLEKGTKTKYYYNGRNQVVMKIENYIAGSGQGGTITADDIVTQTTTDPCIYNNQFSTGIVTVYIYDSVTNLLTKIIDTNCLETTYEYDTLHRLKFIKDNDGNIIQEFDTSFKRY